MTPTSTGNCDVLHLVVILFDRIFEDSIVYRAVESSFWLGGGG